jgi:hypothetical protein
MTRMNSTLTFLLVAALGLLPSSVCAGSLFVANLDGTQEVPPTPTTGFGYATITLNDAMTQITVTLDWNILFAGVTEADIDTAPPGFNGPIVFSLALGSGAGTPAGSIDPSPQIFAITPAQVADLVAGNDYVNVETSVFPTGEIRGQFVMVPEPSSLTLTTTALALGLLSYGRRRHLRKPGLIPDRDHLLRTQTSGS